MAGRSPVESPALYLASVSSKPTWFTSDTSTDDSEPLNSSTSCWSTVSLARSIQCHMVISTGFDAFFSAPSGQVVLLAATAGDGGSAARRAGAPPREGRHDRQTYESCHRVIIPSPLLQ